MQSKILLIIPAYNEEDCLADVVNNIITHYPAYDYVVVNDGSDDYTRKICLDNGYNFIDYPVNLGLTSAFRGGVIYALSKKYEYVLQCDADGQHDPGYVENMLEAAAKEHADVVIGSRFINNKKPFSFRMIGSRFLSACIYVTTHKKIKDPTSGMRLFNKRAIELIYSQRELGPEPDTVAHLIKNNINVIEIPVSISERKAGSSYLTLASSIKYMFQMCLSITIVELFRKKGR